MLAFRVGNVVFSLVVGAVLLTLGAYGRFAGSVPRSSPYSSDVDPSPSDAPPRPVDPEVAQALAHAERAVAEHHATPAQAAGVEAALRHRTGEDRSRAFLDVVASAAPDPSASGGGPRADV